MREKYQGMHLSGRPKLSLLEVGIGYIRSTLKFYVERYNAKKNFMFSTTLQFVYHVVWRVNQQCLI